MDTLAHRSPKHLNSARQRGFTLIEMVIVIVILSIVATIGSLVMSQGFTAYFTNRDITDGDWQARVALERMTRELRAVRSNTTAADLTIAATSVQFTDTSGAPVCFYLNGTTLSRSADANPSACGTTNPQPLADNISALAFSYLQNDGRTVAATSNQVAYITADISVLIGGTVTVSYRTTVNIRNL